MAVKRRIVWFSDEDWAMLQAMAEERGESISATLREGLAGDRAPVRLPSVPEPWSRLSRPVGTAMAQAERDAVLNRVNRGKKP